MLLEAFITQLIQIPHIHRNLELSPYGSASSIPSVSKGKLDLHYKAFPDFPLDVWPGKEKKILSGYTDREFTV